MNAELTGPARASDPVAPVPAAARPFGVAGRLARLVAGLCRCALRSRGVQAADLDDRLLADVGLTRWDVAEPGRGRADRRDRAEHLRRHGHWMS